MKYRVQPNQIEKLMRDEDFIVSKTDTKGLITYGNKIFQEFSGYTEKEIIGASHNIIRHPDMPRGIFKFIWDELVKQHEVLVYLKNMAADGSFYWVFATMTPSFDSAGKVIGYYSVRRAPGREAINTIQDIYRPMLEEEAKVGSAAQPDASLKLLNQILAEKGVSYADFILSI
jgi:PAS domain S-box-containing protein